MFIYFVSFAKIVDKQIYEISQTAYTNGKIIQATGKPKQTYLLRSQNLDLFRINDFLSVPPTRSSFE
jgi:hypothetical protein